MALLTTLLAVHGAYFQRQRCKDRFEVWEHPPVCALHRVRIDIVKRSSASVTDRSLQDRPHSQRNALKTTTAKRIHLWH